MTKAKTAKAKKGCEEEKVAETERVCVRENDWKFDNFIVCNCIENTERRMFLSLCVWNMDGWESEGEDDNNNHIINIEMK